MEKTKKCLKLLAERLSNAAKSEDSVCIALKGEGVSDYTVNKIYDVDVDERGELDICTCEGRELTLDPAYIRCRCTEEDEFECSIDDKIAYVFLFDV